jgi:hypothetical protein
VSLRKIGTFPFGLSASNPVLSFVEGSEWNPRCSWFDKHVLSEVEGRTANGYLTVKAAY